MRPARLSLIVTAGLATFVGLVALQHLLRPGLPAADHFVSEYAVGSTRVVQTVAFLAWAVAAGACALLAVRALPSGRRIARTSCAAGFGIATVGLLLAAAFVTQTVAGELPDGVERTTAGRLHDVGTLLILAGLLLAALASLRLVRSWSYRGEVAALGVALVAIVPLLVAVGWDAPGVGQRAFILVGVLSQWRFARAVARRRGDVAGETRPAHLPAGGLHAAALAVAGLLLCAPAASAACDRTPGERRVLGQVVHVPEDLPARPPLVLVLHGLGGTGRGLAEGLGFVDLARRDGFVVAAPKSRARDWELNGRRGEHDLPRTRRLIDVLTRRLCLDRRRVYATGFSNGASFAARLGCDLHTRIAAIAPVAGSYVAQRACPPSRGRMPTLEQHGVDQFAPSVPRLIAMTRARNRCTRAPVRAVVGTAVRTTYPGCALQRYAFPRIGHAWPPDGAARSWRFLRRYAR